MKVTKEMKAAMKFCVKGCEGNYSTCQRCHEPEPYTFGNFRKVPQAGTNDICPLAKYNVPDQEIPEDVRERWAMLPDEEDCEILCLACEHCDIEIRDGEEYLRFGRGNEEEWENFCLDCPVFKLREAILEAEAEAAAEAWGG